MTTESLLLESQISQLGRGLNDTGPNTGPLAGILNANKIHLGKSNLAITPATTYAALAAQEADYDGYAATVIAWDAPSTAADGTVEVVSTPVVFRPTGATVDDAIWNLWLSNGGSSAWNFAGALVGGPLPMGDALDQMVVTLRFRPATGTVAVVIA